jgi:hypothetical protein
VAAVLTVILLGLPRLSKLKSVICSRSGFEFNLVKIVVRIVFLRVENVSSLAGLWDFVGVTLPGVKTPG